MFKAIIKPGIAALCALIIGASLPCFAGSTTAGRERVRWMDRVVAHEGLSMKHLVDLTSTSESFLRSYGNIEVPVGRAKAIDTSYLIKILTSNGFNPGNATIEGPATIKIERGIASTPCGKRAAELISTAISTATGAPPDAVTVRINECSDQCGVLEKMALRKGPLPLGRNVKVELSGADSADIPLTITALVDASASMDVAVARAPIAAGSEFSASMVTFERAVIEAPDADLVLDVRNAIGRGARASADIAAGERIRAHHLKGKTALQKGDMVALESRTPGLVVRGVGRVTSDAAMGDTVSVENVDSKKQLLGKVIGNNTVLIEH